MKRDVRTRQWLSLLLAALLLGSSLFPGRVMAAEETEPAETEAETKAPVETIQTLPEDTEPDDTVATEGTTHPTQTTEAPEETTFSTEGTLETTFPTEETTQTVPYTEPAETIDCAVQLMEQMAALEWEAQTLEPELDILEEFTYRLRQIWNAAYDAYEDGLLTDGDLTIIDDQGWGILDDLKEAYGYENGALAPLAIQRYGSRETPMEATAENSVATLGNSSGIKFRIFNYTNGTDENGNYIVSGGINDNGLSGYFNFRGTSYENTGADGTAVSSITNSVTDIDGYTANHATVLPNLSGGYPVFDGSRDDGPQKSLGYLFGAGGKGVTAYTAGNTLLRLNEQGQYYYDSAQNAVDFDTASRRFIVRTYRERGKTTAGQGSGQYYDFFPFTYWDGSTVADPDSAHWYNYNNTAEVDYWYGMTMEACFSMPEGGIVNGQDDMVFSFSGDDDVWVFIDDVLVLDLGGTHGVVSGSINFATGEVKQYLDWGSAGESSTGTSRPTRLETRFASAGKEPNGGWNSTEAAYGKVFADYTEHTIKFFYLERATSCANCKIRFNMPILPTGELTVEKRTQGALTDLTSAEEYSFALRQLVNAEEKAASGIGYDRIDADTGAVLGTGLTASDGSFSLKAGQRAKFDLTAGRTYLVREMDTGACAEAWKCTVNGVPQEAPDATDRITMDPDVPVEAVFTNALKTTALTVIKKVAGNMGDRERMFTFTVRLYGDAAGEKAIPFPEPEPGEAYALAGGGATFQISHGETGITLDDIPIGAWAVISETGAEEYKTMYQINDETQNGTTARFSSIEEPASVTFTNTREVLIETGVSLDWVPYVQMLAGSGAGILLLRRHPRKKE